MTLTLDQATLPELVLSGMKDGAFSSYFQPKFDPDSEEIVSLEALLRWRHPSAGFSEAGWFMPAVERSESLVENVDAWVLNDTTRQAKTWLDNDLDFGFLNVNISAWHAGDRLIGMVKDALKSSGFPAKLLALECPWRMLAANGDTIAPTMRKLRKLGCAIVLDGNPLDQACLDQVRQTPVQMSKVCIAFMQEFSETHGNRALSALIKEWRRRGVQIVAMGVEREDQTELSREVGCRYAQGNRFKSPLPADEISYLLKIIAQTKQALNLL